MPKKLEVKTWRSIFETVWNSDDEQIVPIHQPNTEYGVGTQLSLKEYDPNNQTFSGRVIEAEVVNSPEKVTTSYSMARVRIKQRHHSRYPFDRG